MKTLTMTNREKSKVWATYEPLPPVVDFLTKRVDFDYNRTGELATREMIRRNLPGRQGLLTTLRDRLDAELIEQAPDLKVISTLSVGYDSIDLEAATRRGIWVTNTPDVLTEATADLAWALLLAVARRIPESDRFVREGRYSGWRNNLMLGTEISGKTLGIWGAGRIAQAIARRAFGFNLRILYHNRTRKPEWERELRARFVEFPELLRQSDFLMPLVPLNEETRGRLGLPEFNLMKSSAILVNVARGALLDEEALVKVLHDHRLAGAGLDVYVDTVGIHQKLGGLDHVVLTPHIGSATVETRERMAYLAAENLITALHGGRPENAVNEVAPRLIQADFTETLKAASA